MKVTQLCLTVCNPIDYTVHGILQARILEWAAFPVSRGSFPGTEPGSPMLQVDSLPAEPQGSPCIVKAMVFPVVMYKCDTWTIKNIENGRIDAFKLQCWWRLENLLDSKEIKPVNLKENQSWIFIGRTGAEVEAPILWPLDVKSQLIGKDPGAVKDWRQKEKGAAEDEMVGWHHRLNEQHLGGSEGHGSLTCCSPQGWKEWDMAEPLNDNNILILELSQFLRFNNEWCTYCKDRVHMYRKKLGGWIWIVRWATFSTVM